MSFITTRPASVRPAAVAGSFYPEDARLLEDELAGLLEQAGERALAPGFPKLLIVPHAGYVYSGPVAASAYAALAPARGLVRRVVLLGPCHRVAVRGLALPAASAFETPLGRVPIDADAVAALRTLPQVTESAATHAREHALEVQLPFLQRVLGEFSIVPLVVGDTDPQAVAEVIERLWGGPETLIVISSDLSHYLPYDVARAVDAATVDSILGFETGISHEHACGATPIAGALVAARRRGLTPELLDCRNSGDTAGDKRQVVGYASFAFEEARAGYGPGHGRRLLAIARASIQRAFRREAVAPAFDDPWLREWRATFVTLKLDGELRGCVGALVPHRPLAEDVAANASAAAFQDPRFAPLREDELTRAEIEVSLLSLPTRIGFADHGDLLARLRRGADGLILEHREDPSRRATFLPQVWESLPDPGAFVEQLKRKAGFAPGEPTTRFIARRYAVLKWREGGLRA
jgi:AmmeMemoRadiSam system protein B/AmmeMemoRadiSam system protein A